MRIGRSVQLPFCSSVRVTRKPTLLVVGWIQVYIDISTQRNAQLKWLESV
jgi:hypothetical protein